MTNGHGIETPANKIATAQVTLCLAFRLSGDVEAGRITAEIFKRGVTVDTGGGGLELSPSPEKTDQNLKDEIFNIVLNALSASALTVDETLEEVLAKLRPSEPDLPGDLLRGLFIIWSTICANRSP